MAEMVYRRKRQRRVRMLDETRFTLPTLTRAQVQAALQAVAEALPGFLLSLADLLEMPSGLHAAYVAGLAALGRRVRWPVAGAAAAMLIRLLSGLQPHWEGLVTLSLLLGAPMVLHQRGNGMLMGYTATALLPMLVCGWMAPTAMELLLSMCSLTFSTLCAPLICRGVKALVASSGDGAGMHIDALEDRLGTVTLALLMMCGGARLLLVGMNAGFGAAAAGTLLLAMYFGAGAGSSAGIIAGMALALMGLPLQLAVSLAAGGFLAGVMRATGRRWLCCLSFGAVTLISMLISGTAGVGCGAAAAASALGIACMPAGLRARSERFFRRFRSNLPQAGNACAASMLSAWEKTVDAMAVSVPYPDRMRERQDGNWWRARLCEGCPEAEECSCMDNDHAAERANEVWSYREAEESMWAEALEGLRGLGCQRLYHLRQGMEGLRQEAAVRRRSSLQAMEQRSMLVTHLTAMAGAARNFAHLSQGENWWDAMIAARIRRALDEAASSVRLLWVRRLQGHVHAAFELQDVTGTRRQAGELCALVEEAAGGMMMTVGVDGNRVRLAQRPPLEAGCGVASACITTQAVQVCGDTAWSGLLQDGRFMAAVSDGMGHGAAAAQSSRQTVELLRLCLDAGYTLQQTLAAVNGMMLLGGDGERFVTVDLLIIDLWSGQAMLEKMGAAGSWLQQQGTLKQLTGDALPMGVLEGVQSGESLLRLAAGDALILMTDGVEEAFPGSPELEDAIRAALLEESPQDAAESLLEAAVRADGGVSQDDQTVLVVRIGAVQTTMEDV